MVLIYLAIAFIGLFVISLVAIALSPNDHKGCPKCHRFSGLVKTPSNLWISWLALFHHRITRRKCEHCGWRGAIRW